MALNFSHRPLFSEPPMRMANGYHLFDEKVENGFDYVRDRSCSGSGGSQDSNMHKDILDLLPSDPFGMDISTTFTAALSGFLGDYSGYGNDEVGPRNDGNYQMFAGLNFLFQTFPSNLLFDYSSRNGFGDSCLFDKNSLSGFGDCSELGNACAARHSAFGLACNAKDPFSLGNELVVNAVDGVASEGSGEFYEGSSRVCSVGDEGVGSCEVCSDGDEGALHPALGFALGYLGVRDLLVVETVCKSLRSTVRNDPLLWRNIHIEHPMNEKINDDLLLQLTNRAQGSLQCLSLIECKSITENGLKLVLENNPKLTKLNIPACTRLSIEGIVSTLKEFKSNSGCVLKHLRIGGIYGVTQKHFEELKLVLDMNGHMGQNSHKPHFYLRRDPYISCEDDREIDIEMCPKCSNMKLVYDCPSEDCQRKGDSLESCRACMICIERCVWCGCCFKDDKYVETFILEKFCLRCAPFYPRFQEEHLYDQLVKTCGGIEALGGVLSTLAHESSSSNLHG